VNVFAFIFNKNTKVDLISTFIGELPKSQMWQKEEKIMQKYLDKQLCLCTAATSETLSFCTEIQGVCH
jgi:hypothetical protein